MITNLSATTTSTVQLSEFWRATRRKKMRNRKTLRIALILLLLTSLQQKVEAQFGGNAEVYGILGDIFTCNDFQNQSIGIVEGGMPGTLISTTYGTNTDGRRTEC